MMTLHYLVHCYLSNALFLTSYVYDDCIIKYTVIYQIHFF